MRMQIILMRCVIMVLLINSTVVEVSIWMGDLGCGQPILLSVLRMETMLHDVMYRAASCHCCQGHDEFNDLCNGQDGTVCSWYGFVLGEEDVGSGSAA